MALSLTGPYPASYALFSPFFRQPEVPTLTTELQGQFMQHKWDQDVSHITAGFWYNSAENGKVRIDESYQGAYGTSIFDYTNATKDGAVSNTQIIIEPSVGSESTCFDAYVDMPGFPLITSDLLQSFNATFGGIVNEPFLGWTQTWNVLYAGVIPITAYLNINNTVMGFDFFGEERRTKVVTRFFAQSDGPAIAPAVFEPFSCSGPSPGNVKKEI